VEEIQSLLHGFAVALTWQNLVFMFTGVILGVIIGVLPGLGGANGIAILLPLTFSMAQQPGGALVPGAQLPEHLLHLFEGGLGGQPVTNAGGPLARSGCGEGAAGQRVQRLGVGGCEIAHSDSGML
jgi:hypothetical protein